MLSRAGALTAARRLSSLCVHFAANHPAPVRHIGSQRRHEVHTAGICASTTGREAPAHQRRGESTQSGSVPPKAALLLIGNEILSGSIQDTNTPWLAQLLYSRGIDLIRAETIPDDADDISTTLQDLKLRVGGNGLIFTSGGIGPTHDDVTYEGVAKACDVTLQRHEPTIERMRENYSKRGLELNDARLRMATIPSPAQVLFSGDLWVPLVVAQCGGASVYVLPAGCNVIEECISGIPRLFKQMVEANVETLPRGPACVRRELGTQLGEGDLAQTLSSIAAQHTAVRIGSYPATDPDVPYKVLLRFEGRDEAAVAAAAAAVADGLDVFEL